MRFVFSDGSTKQVSSDLVKYGGRSRTWKIEHFALTNGLTELEVDAARRTNAQSFGQTLPVIDLILTAKRYMSVDQSGLFRVEPVPEILDRAMAAKEKCCLPTRWPACHFSTVASSTSITGMLSRIG